MRVVGMLALAAGAALGGYLVWRRTTSTMFYRSANSSVRPSHVPAEAYEDWVIARRKRWRLVKAVVGAVIGAIIAGVLFKMIDSGLQSR